MHNTHNYSRYTFFLLLAISVVFIAYSVRHTLSCLLLSVVLAYFADPLVTVLENKNIRRPYGIGLIYAGAAILLFLFVDLVLPVAAQNWEAIVQELPGNLAKTRAYIGGLNSFNSVVGPQNLAWVADILGGDEWGHKIGMAAQGIASGLAYNIFNIILAPLVIFFLLLYKRDILNVLTLLLPISIRGRSGDIWCDLHQSIGQYVRGQILISLFVSAASIGILFYFHIDYPVLNGIFAGAVSMLPFIGIIIASVPAMFLSFVKYQSFVSVLNVFAAYGAVYFIEGKIVKPVIFKGTMDIHPLLTITSVMVFGELLGVWGFLLALPIVSLVQIIVKYMASAKKEASPIVAP